MDWLGMTLTFASTYLLARKNRWGWAINWAACLIWMVYAIWIAHSIPIVILNMVLIITSVRGFRNWGTGPAKSA